MDPPTASGAAHQPTGATVVVQSCVHADEYHRNVTCNLQARYKSGSCTDYAVIHCVTVILCWFFNMQMHSIKHTIVITQRGSNNLLLPFLLHTSCSGLLQLQWKAEFRVNLNRFHLNMPSCVLLRRFLQRISQPHSSSTLPWLESKDRMIYFSRTRFSVSPRFSRSLSVAWLTVGLRVPKR